MLHDTHGRRDSTATCIDSDQRGAADIFETEEVRVPNPLPPTSKAASQPPVSEIAVRAKNQNQPKPTQHLAAEVSQGAQQAKLRRLVGIDQR